MTDLRPTCVQDQHRVMRAEREFLRLVYPVPRSTNQQLAPIQKVGITFHGQQSVWRRLHYTGILRAGTLFGYKDEEDENGLLKITNVTDGGSPLFAAQHHPFDLCSEYLLGYSELMRQVSPTWDWHGQWVIHPDGSLGSSDWQQRVLEEFVECSRIREDFIVIFLGEVEGQPAAKAYNRFCGEVQPLAVALSVR